VGKKSVLLRSVETVYLIHKHDSLTFIDSIAFIGFFYNHPDIRNTGQDGIKRLKACLGTDGNYPRQRRFPAPGWPV
jgi:hypothetical protein